MKTLVGTPDPEPQPAQTTTAVWINTASTAWVTWTFKTDGQ